MPMKLTKLSEATGVPVNTMIRWIEAGDMQAQPIFNIKGGVRYYLIPDAEVTRIIDFARKNGYHPQQEQSE